MRPARQIRGDAAAAVVLFGVLLLTNAYFLRSDYNDNSNSRLGLVFAIVQEGRLTIDSFHNHPWLHTVDKAHYDGRYYSDKAPGTAALGVVAYTPLYHGFRVLGIDPNSWVVFSLTRYLLTVLVVGGPSALVGAATYLFLRRVTRDGWRSYLATIAVAIGTMILPFSTLFFGHTLAAAALFVAFLMAVRWRHSDARSRPWYFCRLGAALGFAVVTEYPAVLAAVPIFLYALVPRRSEPGKHLPAASIAALLAGGVLPLTLYLAYNTICFGGPFSVGYAHEATAVFRETHATGVLGMKFPRPEVLYYLTLHPIRGLFLQSPVLLASIAGLYLMARSAEWRLEALLVSLIVAAFLLMNAAFAWWWGGWTFGPRHLIPTLWFLAVPLVFLPRRLSPTIAFLVVLSAVQMGIATASNPLVPDLAAKQIDQHGIASVFSPSPIFDQCLPMLGRQEYANNLGRLVGLPGAASLLPLVAAWIGVTALVRRWA